MNVPPCRSLTHYAECGALGNVCDEPIDLNDCCSWNPSREVRYKYNC